MVRSGAGAVSKSIHLTSKIKEERETQCLRVSIAAAKQHEQSKYWRKGPFWLTLQQHFVIEGDQDRNSNRIGTWRQELVQRR